MKVGTESVGLRGCKLHLSLQIGGPLHPRRWIRNRSEVGQHVFKEMVLDAKVKGFIIGFQRIYAKVTSTSNSPRGPRPRMRAWERRARHSPYRRRERFQMPPAPPAVYARQQTTGETRRSFPSHGVRMPGLMTKTGSDTDDRQITASGQLEGVSDDAHSLADVMQHTVHRSGCSE
jgi:hypothetical protein